LVPSTGQLVQGGILNETDQLMKNILNILKAAGATMDDIVECTCFLADFNDFTAFNLVYSQYFNGTAYPARATF